MYPHPSSTDCTVETLARIKNTGFQQGTKKMLREDNGREPIAGKLTTRNRRSFPFAFAPTVISFRWYSKPITRLADGLLTRPSQIPIAAGCFCPILLQREGARLALKVQGRLRLLDSFPLCLPAATRPSFANRNRGLRGRAVVLRRCVCQPLLARLIRNRPVGKGFPISAVLFFRASRP